MQKIQQERIKEALQTLSLRQRQLIEMAFFKSITHYSIFRATGLSLRVGKGQIRQVLLKLKPLLTYHQDEENLKLRNGYKWIAGPYIKTVWAFQRPFHLM